MIYFALHGFSSAIPNDTSTFLQETFGLDPVQTESILYSIMALVLGQGIADTVKAKKEFVY